MKTRLAILLWAATPERPELCATPFVLATAAAALDCEVEIHFAGRATRLLVNGVAERLYPAGEKTKSVYVFMKEAANLGVRFLGCGMALKGQTAPDEEFIVEYAGSATVTDFVLRALDPEWSTLIF
jgi:predicted peroxiredoxin